MNADIPVIDEAEAAKCGGNWIGTLGRDGGERLVRTRGLAEAWVRKVSRGWPGDWAVFESRHFRTGESNGWGAVCR